MVSRLRVLAHSQRLCPDQFLGDTDEEYRHRPPLAAQHLSLPLGTTTTAAPSATPSVS